MKTKIQNHKAICLHFYCWLVERLEQLSNDLLSLKLEYIMAITAITITGLAFFFFFLGKVESGAAPHSI